MTFTFFPNVPAAPDDPADDQPQMQQNNSAIFNLIPVDHIGFNALANNGKHQQVQLLPQTGNADFPQVADQGTLFVKRTGVGNQTELFFAFDSSIVKAPLQITNNQIAVGATSAVIPLMAGFTMCFGNFTTTGTNTVVPFGVQFTTGGGVNPANPYSVQVTSATLTINLAVTAVTPTTFTVSRPAIANTLFYWVAIGPST